MRNNKNTYEAPQISVDYFINTEVLCGSTDATNESFTDEVEIEW